MAGDIWSGVKEFTAALEHRVTAVDGAVRGVVSSAALELEAAVKGKFSQQHAAGTPTPSAPGSPPAVITGTLRRSYHSTPAVRLGFGKYVAQVGPSVVYSRIQELGGQAGVNGSVTLPARPAFGPAFEEWRAAGRFRERLAEAVSAAIH